MEYVGLLWFLVPIVTVIASIIKYLFWLLLIALLFTANDAHLKNARIVIFIVISIYVSIIIFSEKSYNVIGFVYAFGGLLAYVAFHLISGAINRAEKRRKLKSKE